MARSKRSNKRSSTKKKRKSKKVKRLGNTKKLKAKGNPTIPKIRVSKADPITVPSPAPRPVRSVHDSTHMDVSKPVSKISSLESVVVAIVLMATFIFVKYLAKPLGIWGICTCIFTLALSPPVCVHICSSVS